MWGDRASGLYEESLAMFDDRVCISLNDNAGVLGLRV